MDGGTYQSHAGRGDFRAFIAGRAGFKRRLTEELERQKQTRAGDKAGAGNQNGTDEQGCGGGGWVGELVISISK